MLNMKAMERIISRLEDQIDREAQHVTGSEAILLGCMDQAAKALRGMWERLKAMHDEYECPGEHMTVDIN